jgi:Zinc carboxypeptidase
MRRFLAAVGLFLLVLVSATPDARQSREWWPGAAYDPGIPAPKSVLGYEIGDYWTDHHQMLDYMRRLEAASKRVKVFSVGRTNEKRELILVAISDPGNIQRLEEIRTAVARLRDPRQLPEAQAREIARSTPAIAWMNFANDGNESAAFETGVQLAYHLAAGTDATTRRILKDVVTIIYPAHNPESHSRHVVWMKASATGSSDPDAQEHRGDWRMDTNNNHYQIDLNRDAAFLSQVESQTIVRELHRWNPVVFIDHHGNPDRFFFPPWALPVNAQVDPASRKWVETFGKNIAAAFDRSGWTYFTRQVYDLHYPGYYDRVGESAPRKAYGFYDVNAWSLPLAYGVEAYWTEDATAAGLQRVTERPARPLVDPERARYAYLFRWNSRGAARLVAALWKEGFQLAVATEPMTVSGRQHGPGIAVARVQTNPASLHERIVALAKAFEVELSDAASAMVEAGRDLGDRSVVDLKPARIAIVSEPPTSSTAYGATWFLMEQQYGIPFTAIKAADLPGVELAKYNVIVLPDGQTAGYTRAFPQEAIDRLKAWVREGGTLVAIKGAAVWASGERVALTTARDKYAAPAGDETKREDPPKRIDTVPGAFVQLDVDGEHYLGLGVDAPIAALFRSNVVFNPTRRGAKVAALHKERPIVAGFVFDEAREALKGAPYLWDEPTGRGHVTLFADDPAFRTFLHGAHRLLLNAILLGPSM